MMIAEPFYKSKLTIMKKLAVTILPLIALLLFTAKSFSQESLYKRLGGYDAIAAVVENLLPRLMSDPKLARFADQLIARRGSPPPAGANLVWTRGRFFAPQTALLVLEAGLAKRRVMFCTILWPKVTMKSQSLSVMRSS